MANKPINALPALDELQSDDLLAVWDSSLNTAVKMSGQQMVARLTEIADGHGGISGIAKTGTAGLNDTYTITYADGTTSTFIVSNGAKGDTGDQTFVWIAYSAVSPTSDADVSVIPAPWMGIYVGLESTQGNLHYTDYTWYEIKGPKGDGVAYTAQTGTAGLTRTYTMYTADGTAVGTFSVTDGEGAVSTVNGIAPDGDGDVSTVVGSVADLGLTVGSATIADAYTALLPKQVLLCPASDFAVGELPSKSGSRQTDGSIEIVKGDGTDGWIEFHGRQKSVGDFRMFFTSSDVPSGTWIPTTATISQIPSGNTTYISGSNYTVYIYRTGNVVSISGRFTVVNAIPGYTDIFTIPSEYRGNSNLPSPAFLFCSGVDGAWYPVYTYTGEAITTIGSTMSAREWFISGSWIVN